MLPDALRQINQRPGCIEKDGLEHAGLIGGRAQPRAFRFSRPDRRIIDNDVCSNRGMKAIDELFAAPKWTQSPGEEIANSVSHGLGLAAALIASPFLCAAAARQENPAFLVG